MTSSSDWTEVVGAVGVFALLITVIVVVAALVGGRLRARSQASRDAEHRRLAEQVVTGQESIAGQLAETNQHLSDLRKRMAKVEEVLKQVE
ncbi:MAG TPA: hypothetical protein VN408_16710 [Actinoplanes sp.]|nr:hypothetical protein [Actinoplanes sp.]